MDDGSLSGPGDLCRFTFSRADNASAIDKLMLFGKGASEVGDIERDVEVTSPLLKVEKEEKAVESLSFVLVNTWLLYMTFARIEPTCLSQRK